MDREGVAVADLPLRHLLCRRLESAGLSRCALALCYRLTPVFLFIGPHQHDTCVCCCICIDVPFHADLSRATAHIYFSALHHLDGTTAARVRTSSSTKLLAPGCS